MKRILYIFSVVGVIISTLASNLPANAQSNECRATANRGYKCYQDRPIRARSGYPGTDTGTFTYSPPPGYRLMDYKEVVQARFGEGGNVNINFVRSGTVAELRMSIGSSNKSLVDRKSRIQAKATVPIEGVPVNVGGEIEAIDKALSENNSRLEMLSRDNSNVDRVQATVTVRGRCTKQALGVCVDNQGGKYEGYIRFNLEYVGTPEEIKGANEVAIKRAENALNLLEQASKSSGNTGNSGNSGNNAASAVRVFENPRGTNGVPIDAVLKGANGLDPNARQQGANAFCQSNGYKGSVDFQFAGGSNIGTVQWDRGAGSWAFCASCGMYLTKVTCQ